MSFPLLNTETYKPALVASPKEVLFALDGALGQYLKAAAPALVRGGGGSGASAVERGMRCVAHVFNNVLLYTRNLDAALYHATRASVYYCEFVSQISDDGRHYLQLTSRDAVLFTYKKTIYDLNTEEKTTFSADTSLKAMLGWLAAASSVCLALRARCIAEACLDDRAALRELERSQRAVVSALAACSPSVLGDICVALESIADAGGSGAAASAIVVAIARRVRRCGGQLSLRILGRKLTEQPSLLAGPPARVAAEIVV
jgi:hypothetical protein